MIQFRLFDSYEKSVSRKSHKWLENHELGKGHLKLFKLLASLNYGLIKDFSYPETDDSLTIKYLSSRIFNFSLVSFRAALNGYYQVSFSLMRELIEVHFLLDYFSTNKEKISYWKSLDNKSRVKEFSPHILYKALDERDGFLGEERKRQYQMFCELAAHASYKGFQLLANSSNMVETGFFFDEKKLLSNLYELTKRYGVLVLTLPKFLPADNTANINLYIKTLVQYQKVHDSEVTRESIKKLIKLLRKKKKVLTVV